MGRREKRREAENKRKRGGKNKAGSLNNLVSSIFSGETYCRIVIE